MFSRVEEAASRRASSPRLCLSSTAFAAGAFLTELLVIVSVAVLTGVGYHVFAYEFIGSIENFVDVGLLIAMTYTMAFAIRDEYGIEHMLEGGRGNVRLFLVWNLAFAGIAVVGFLTKSTGLFSRGWLVLFYVLGFLAAVAIDAALHRCLAAMIARGMIRQRKLMIVGTSDEISRLSRQIADGAASAYIAARAVLPAPSDAAGLDSAIEKAVLNARMLGIEDVVISSGLAESDTIERCLSAFNLLPVAIHIGAGGLIGRFKDARIARFGRATTLSLTRVPLGQFEALAKRAIDVGLASLALFLLSPLFALIALAIRFNSKGPVFFRQRRRGYNLEEFAIWKFRTMTTLDDGDAIRQATKNDQRVTSVGRVLRRYSLDELPQLFNVLKGEMSIVGPRPHAVAHDRMFEKRIALYPRRLNVKPGITGWAQVNGFRGATETDDAMRQRVAHDLYYIDNWSIAFDLYIVMLTVLSRKASQNAY